MSDEKWISPPNITINGDGTVEVGGRVVSPDEADRIREAFKWAIGEAVWAEAVKAVEKESP